MNVATATAAAPVPLDPGGRARRGVRRPREHQHDALAPPVAAAVARAGQHAVERPALRGGGLQRLDDVLQIAVAADDHTRLTGRAAAYLDPDRFSEVTGFTNPDESKHDQFVLGHTGTSISLACGLAKTRDMEGPNSGIGNVIAVIGGPKIHSLGYSYALLPVAAGALILLVVALLFNNIPDTRKYPEYWI